MIEAKGGKGKLEKLNKEGEIVGVVLYDKDTVAHKKGDKNYSAIENYAVNGALHYGEAILDYTDYKEVIIIGINGHDWSSQLKNSKIIGGVYLGIDTYIKNSEIIDSVISKNCSVACTSLKRSLILPGKSLKPSP